MRLTGPRNIQNRSRARLCRGHILFLFALLAVRPVSGQEEKPRLRVTLPSVVLRDVPVNAVNIEVLTGTDEVDEDFDGEVQVRGLRIVGADKKEERPTTLQIQNGVLTPGVQSDLASGTRVYVNDDFEVTLSGETHKASLWTRFSAGFWSLLPPLVAIGLAIWLKDVYVALLAAVYSGCLILAGWNPWLAFTSMFNADKMGIAKVLADPWNMQVIVFTLFLGAMVQIMSNSGGTGAVVRKLSRVTSTRERGQVLTWFMGLLIFFDDYANTMLVGNAMRPVTDRLKISRQKLAFLIDSTAAPIAGLAIVSTWVGVELGAIRQGLESLNVPDTLTQQVFISSIPYRFYPIFLIGFVVLIAATGRDYGPMLNAERDALERDDSDSGVELGADEKSSVWYAIAPIAVLVGWIAVGFVMNLKPDWTLNDDFDSVPLLLHASFFAAITAAALSVGGKALTLTDAAEAWMKGMTEMFPALVVLVLAWSVSSICKVEGLNTAGYIVEQIGDSISPRIMPTIAFVVSGAIAFAVGSSYATMGLLIPLFIALVGSMLGAQGPEAMQAAVMGNLMLGTVGAILAGSIFGDHCSPISDTTVLSSAGAQCNHLAHVATQLPYALTVGVIAIVCGYLPAGFGMNPWYMLPVGLVACAIVIFVAGRRADAS